jgi:hypothetical protein
MRRGIILAIMAFHAGFARLLYRSLYYKALGDLQSSRKAALVGKLSPLSSRQKRLRYPFEQGEIATPPSSAVHNCPPLTSPSRTLARRIAMAPSSPSLTASPLRACSIHARKGGKRPFTGPSKRQNITL